MSTECGFLRLPTELRLGIYEYLFDPTYWRTSPKEGSRTRSSENRVAPRCTLIIYDDIVATRPTIIPSSYRSPRRVWQPKPSQFPVFLRTCKTVYNEAIDMLYEHTRFELSIWRESNAGDTMHTVATPRGVKYFGALEECKFLQRMRNVEISYHIEMDDHFGRDLRRLEDVVACLHAPRETAIVRMQLWNPKRCLMSDYQWYVALGRLKDVNRKCRVILREHISWEKAKIKRLAQLLEVLGPEAQTPTLRRQLLTDGTVDEMELTANEEWANGSVEGQ